MAEMTRDEAAALLERWAGKGLVPSDEECRKAFAVAIAALRSPGAAEMREAAIACVREQAPPRDIRTVVTEAQVSVLDRAIAAIRALPLPAPEVPEEFNWNKAKPFQSADEWYSGKPSNDETHARTAATVQWLIEHGGRFPNEPAPEVPEVIKTWCKNYDATEDCGGLDWARNSRLRDYYRKEHGI